MERVLKCQNFIKFVLIIYVLWMQGSFANGVDNHHIASISESVNDVKLRCGYDYAVKWSHEVSHSSFVSPPLIHDIDADGRDEIIAVTHSETLTVVDAATGAVHNGGHWPVTLFDETFFSSPLLHDVNSDGMLDVILVSSLGKISAHNHEGELIQEATFQLPPLYINKDWHTKVVSLSYINIHDHILDNVPLPSQEQFYIGVDPHVLATPVLADINGDSTNEELVIPVSYYFDLDDYVDESDLLNKRGVTPADLKNYVASSVVYYNLSSHTIMYTVHLDLTMKTSLYPAYLPHSPTLVDLDSRGGRLETLVATLSGNLHVVDPDKRLRHGYPININPAHLQVVADDLLNKGEINMVIADPSGNIACLNKLGKTVWETELEGIPVGGIQLVDLKRDGRIMIAVTAETGVVYFLNSTTGDTIPELEVKLGNSAAASVIVDHLNTVLPPYTLVNLAGDGSLYLSSSSRHCKMHIPVGETSYISAMSHDFIGQSPGRELLLATKDGTLICYGLNPQSVVSARVGRETDNRPMLRDTTISLSVGYDRGSIIVISSTSFTLPVTFTDTRWRSTSHYQLKVTFMNSLLAHERFTEPGHYTLQVTSSSKPSHGHMIIQLSNQHGQVIQQVFPVRFHLDSLDDIQWVLLMSTFSFLALMLVLHAFPIVDLLPFTVANANR